MIAVDVNIRHIISMPVFRIQAVRRADIVIRKPDMPLPERIPQPVQHSPLELVAMLFKPHRVIVIAPNIEQAVPRPDKFPKSFK
ncbi:MAG: hypothetical protein KAQ71_18545, partial [Desulfobulbaceae bacterium]|nr:hypothetical protein [Desulfobulbaceae bacterium]